MGIDTDSFVNPDLISSSLLCPICAGIIIFFPKSGSE
jgi:hypothetical protein